MKKSMLIITLCLCATLNADVFDGAKVGDNVQVNSQKPILILGNATITAVTASNITVITDKEAYTFKRENVKAIPAVQPTIINPKPSEKIPQFDVSVQSGETQKTNNLPEAMGKVEETVGTNSQLTGSLLDRVEKL